MNKVRLLVLSSLYPHPRHSVRAANVVIFELLSAFALEPGVEVGLLIVSRAGVPEVTDDERQGIALLKARGITVQPELTLPKATVHRTRMSRLLWPKLVDFYPEITHRHLVEKAVEEFSPDVILIPWSEWLTATCADMKVIKFAYYGNPDPKSARASLRFERSHGEVNLVKFLVRLWKIKRLEHLHIKQMAKVEILGDVAENDALYYREKGHANAFYIQNIWIDRFGSKWKEMRQAQEGEDPQVIIGSIGKLDGTANSYGLEYLGEHILPKLREKLRGKSYEVHVIGSRKLRPGIAPLLNFPEIHMVGFVDDIDAALVNGSIFLCVNNGTPYKVGHTRYLHAWSLGCCVVAHSDCRLSMPEIVHGKNALLGRTPEEIVDLLAVALSDESLRKKIGEGGYKTFIDHFTAPRIVSKIMERVMPFLDVRSVEVPETTRA